MIVQFSFSNYKSFRKNSVLNLTTSMGGIGTVVFPKYGYNLIQAAAIYGANASGKTVLFKAFDFLKSIVCPPMPKDDNIPILNHWKSKYDTFRLNVDAKELVSSFEVVFLMDNMQYRYRVEVNREVILSECLFLDNGSGDEIQILERHDENGKPVYSSPASYLDANLMQLALGSNVVSPTFSALRVLATFGEPLLKKVLGWFDNVKYVKANYFVPPIPELLNERDKRDIIAFMKSFDFNIEDMKPHEINVEEIPDEIKKRMTEQANEHWYDDIQVGHKLYNNYNERLNVSEWFSLVKDESFGTNRLLSLSSHIISALSNNSVLLIDEFDSGIHPLVAKEIVELFYGKTKSQLIVNTQNISLFSQTCRKHPKRRLFRKDQIYFINKNRYGESSIDSLLNYSDTIDRDFEKHYLDGDVDAVPFVDTESLDKLLNQKTFNNYGEL